MDIEVKGPAILFEIPVLGGIPITETIVNTWLLMIVLTFVMAILTLRMRVRSPGKRQIVAETLAGAVQRMADKNAGAENASGCAFMMALFAITLFSGLMGAAGLFSPAADLSSCIAWALAAFAAITLRRLKEKGIWGYIKSFGEPFKLLTPLNIISEISLPVSMAFRMFGNIASGAIVMLLVYAALANLGSPIFQIGIPAAFSIYFDVFASALQAFIFCMLTMIYIRIAGE